MAVRCPKADCPYSIPEGTDPAVVVALLDAHVKVDHNQASSVKPKPVDRPLIAAGETSEGWQYFKTRWRAYSRASKLAGTDLGIQLLECLEPNLRRDLTRTTKGPTPIEERPEAELLAAIKAMAVVEDNYMVATFAFARTTQDRGESYRSFVSRLRGMAETCEFHETCANCGHVVDHSESRVSDQLCIGMADPDTQKDLMEEATKRMTVEQTLHFVEKKATGKRAANALKAPTTPSTNALDEGADREEAVNSGYKRQQQRRPQSHAKPKALTNQPQATPPKTTDKGTCNFCGRRGHGTSSRTAIRKAQ